MQVLVTGATGKVGNAIASALLDRGEQVRALVRDPKLAASVLPAGVEPIRGDATDAESLAAAVDGCELVFNAMGMPEQWVKDEGIFDQVNALGSGALAAAAKRAGVRRFLHTSTHDVFHAESGERFDETMLADYPKGTAYERSKQHAEELVQAERDGMEVVILNPAGVYGPTPSPTPSFENGLFEPVVRKRLPAVPPGGTGYAFVEGVADGHLLAAERGADGERYILADGYAPFREIAQTVKQVAGRGRVPPVMPIPVARAISATGRGSLAGHPPPPAPAPRPAHLLPLAGSAGLLQGAARARLADDASGGGRPQDARGDGTRERPGVTARRGRPGCSGGAAATVTRFEGFPRPISRVNLRQRRRRGNGRDDAWKNGVMPGLRRSQCRWLELLRQLRHQPCRGGALSSVWLGERRRVRRSATPAARP